MEDSKQTLLEIVDVHVGHNDVEPEQLRVPQYRRDLFPSNVVLSASDLKELCELTSEANDRAKEIEFNKLDMNNFADAEEAKQRVNEFMPIEYSYKAANGDAVSGLGMPKTDDRTFPEDLASMFVSNAAYAEHQIKTRPLNTVEIFLSFEKPTLKIDLETLPSNPTSNRSVINVEGRDEDWVISTTERIQTFLDQRKATRPIIHDSGTYDYFVYLLLLPTGIWLLYKRGAVVDAWLAGQSLFFNVVVGIYAVLLTLLCARFVFQYVRWLFPPMEYFKRNRVGAFVHRGIAATLFVTLVISAVYDVLKWIFSQL